jgi:tetratricopeptide (TPR) repeat protein
LNDDVRIQEAVVWLEECCGFRSMLRQDDPDILLAQHDLALSHVKDTKIKKMIILLEVVVKAKETLAAEHPHQLTSQHALSIIYKPDRQVQKAVELLENVIAIKPQSLENDYLLRLVLLKALAALNVELDNRLHKDLQTNKSSE